jgi:hypothetical protein
MGIPFKQRAIAATLLLLAAGIAGHSLAADVLQTPAESESEANIDEPSEAEIRDILVQESIDRYSSRCACPYHRKLNRRLFEFPNRFRNRYPTVKCGDDSEYIRPGGPTVFCYGSDVPAEMVEAYREHLRSTFLTEPTPKF